MEGDKVVANQRYIIDIDIEKSPSWGHGFRQGQRVVAIRADTGDPATWYCKSMDEGSAWWVHASDLARADEVTDEEVMEVFGLTPRPHCTTCTCYKN